MADVFDLEDDPDYDQMVEGPGWRLLVGFDGIPHLFIRTGHGTPSEGWVSVESFFPEGLTMADLFDLDVLDDELDVESEW